MAKTENPGGWDSMTTVETAESESDDDDAITLEPGEYVVGALVNKRDVGSYSDLMTIAVTGTNRSDVDPGDFVDMWSNGQIEKALERAGIGRNDTVGIKKTDRKREYVDDDGETVEYYEFEVRT